MTVDRKELDQDVDRLRDQFNLILNTKTL